MTRRSRAILLPLVLLLVGGAIVNVAVAWGCEYFDDLSSHVITDFDQPAEFHRSIWSRYAPTEFARSPDDVMEDDEGFGVRTIFLSSDPDETVNGHLWEIASVEIAGWPRWSLVGFTFSAKRERGLGLVEQSNTFLRIYTPEDPSVEGSIWFAQVPVWPGFAINTVFYAVILWALFAAPFALRRRRRIKRGLCPKCAYDLRGTESVACPECGTTIPLSFAQARERDRVREPSWENRDSHYFLATTFLIVRHLLRSGALRAETTRLAMMKSRTMTPAPRQSGGLMAGDCAD